LEKLALAGLLLLSDSAELCRESAYALSQIPGFFRPGPNHLILTS